MKKWGEGEGRVADAYPAERRCQLISPFEQSVACVGYERFFVRGRQFCLGAGPKFVNCLWFFGAPHWTAPRTLDSYYALRDKLQLSFPEYPVRPVRSLWVVWTQAHETFTRRTGNLIGDH